MRQWIYTLRLLRPAILTEGPSAEEAKALQAHVAYLQALADDGHLILAGRTQTTGPETFGLVIFRAEDQAAAQRVMAADPAVAQSVMSAELLPYQVAVEGRFQP